MTNVPIVTKGISIVHCFAQFFFRYALIEIQREREQRLQLICSQYRYHQLNT